MTVRWKRINTTFVQLDASTRRTYTQLMADRVKLSKDGSSIDFVQSESLPTTLKKFRQSPEIEGFYRFIFENDLQKEAYDILEKIVAERKAKKAAEKAAARAAAKAPKLEAKAAAAAEQAASKAMSKIQVKPAAPAAKAHFSSGKTSVAVVQTMGSANKNKVAAEKTKAHSPSKPAHPAKAPAKAIAAPQKSAKLSAASGKSAPAKAKSKPSPVKAKKPTPKKKR